jgi:hypothetical protein
LNQTSWLYQLGMYVVWCPTVFSINLFVPIHLLTTQVSTLWFSYGFGLALPFPKFSFSKSNHTHLPRTNTPTILAYFSSYWLIIMCLWTYLFKRPTKMMTLPVMDEDIATHMRLIFSWTCGKCFFDTCHFYKISSFITFSQVKWLSWDGIHITLHFTCHTMKIYEIKSQHSHKIRNDYLIIQLAFATKCYVNH